MRYRVWICKIVVPFDATLPEGFDGPPRRAAIEAVESAGIPVLTCFSGWNGRLSLIETEIVEERQNESNRHV